jgi:cell wall-associated NlpC family hydrolase
MEATTMNKKGLVLTLVIVLISCLVPLGSSAAYSYETPIGEIVQTVNFRDMPSTSGNQIRYLQTGEIVHIVKKVNDYWLEVKDKNGVVGYVSSSSKYITLRTQAVYPESNGTIVSTVSFRTGPSTSYDRIRYMYSGESIWVLEQANEYWLKVADTNNVIGYISANTKYVETSFVVSSPPLEEPTTAPTGKPNGQIVSSVSFRTGPSTDDSRIRYMQAGELVWILEKTNDYWYKIADASNVVGYISTSDKYVDTMFNEVPSEDEATYEEESNGSVVKTVSFRTGPSTDSDRIRYLQTGEPIWVLSKINAYWFHMKDKNGVTGYVSASATYVTTTYKEEYKLLDRAVAAERVIEAGMRYLGTPYEFGSSRLDTTTFDCSDFVRQSFIDGIEFRLPGDSRSQADYVKQTGNAIISDWRQLQRGDLMFFMAYKGYQPSDYADVDKTTETVKHVGIYLGNGQILHTYSIASGGVKINDIAGTQWENRFLYGGSPMPLK